MIRRTFTAFALLGLLLGLVACSFAQQDDAPAVEMNSCSLDAQCGQGALCTNGMCVASSADVPLEVALLVTPIGGADNANPHPVLLDRFTVSGPDERRIALPPLVTITGQIRNGDLGVDSSLTFTPMRMLNGVAATTVNAATIAGKSAGDDDYNIRLSSGQSYRMLVRPMDTALPPYSQVFDASAGMVLAVDYAELETRAQVFTIDNTPSDRQLLLRALDAKTGEPVSSTAPITKGRAELTFAGEAVPYRLEIRAEQSYDPNLSNKSEGIFCDDDTPMFAVLTLPAESIPKVDAQGVIALKLPETQRIRYEGTVALCEEAAMTPTVALDDLPITLHSEVLHLPDDTAWSASFDATTSARLNPMTGNLSFCVQLMEGDYDVLATPPTSLPCALFAEHLPIRTPDGMAQSGGQLKLPPLAYLQGTLERVNDGPLEGASVEAIALGRSTGLDLAEDDMSVTRYNRSRQAMTESDGGFRVAVDLGTYDVLFKPPVASGFSWQVRHDVAVGARQAFSSIIDMSSPVTLSGELAYREGGDGQQIPLADAEVLAYAVIEDDQGSERAVPIGKAIADDTGMFMLLLPQGISEW